MLQRCLTPSTRFPKQAVCGRHYSALCTQPELVYQDGRLSRLVLDKCPALLRPYYPTFWATNAHVQTLLCGAPGRFYMSTFHWLTNWRAM